MSDENTQTVTAEWAESDEREIRPDAIVLRGQEAQEAGRAMLAWAGHVTVEQVEAAARALYLLGLAVEADWDTPGRESENVKDRYRMHARVALEAAGFTVPEEES